LFLAATPRQHLELFAMLKTGNTSCVEPLLQLVSVMEHANKRVSALSGGNRRKVSIAVSLIGSPVRIFVFVDLLTLNLIISLSKCPMNQAQAWILSSDSNCGKF
jgi:ABC-type cobalamin/Fe3+-siderophores transport system ATPase subunit